MHRKLQVKDFESNHNLPHLLMRVLMKGLKTVFLAFWENKYEIICDIFIEN